MAAVDNASCTTALQKIEMLQYVEIPFLPTAKRLTNVYGAEPGTLAKASSDYFWLTIWDHTHQVLRKGFQLFRSPQPISKWTPTTGQAGDVFFLNSHHVRDYFFEIIPWHDIPDARTRSQTAWFNRHTCVNLNLQSELVNLNRI